MTEEQLNAARYHAACDIAHRWFAFFEGDTEELHQHSEIFAEDVMLVHAGTHLLAKGKAEMIQWLSSLPYEKGSHFIRSIDVIPARGNEAEVNMQISYQMLDEYKRVGGALSEYRAKVRFDEKSNALFTFIQKTPRFANPDKVFRDSFTANRLHSFIARFSQLMLSDSKSIPRLLSENTDVETAGIIEKLKRGPQVIKVKLLSFDYDQLSCNFLITLNDKQQALDLSLKESPGRYMTIVHATHTDIHITRP